MTLATVLFSRAEMIRNRISDAGESDVDLDLDLLLPYCFRKKIAWKQSPPANTKSIQIVEWRARRDSNS
ncbi:MAG: hypothetical protein KGL35_02775 [Bradyrhizobium sp.]|uniref:hypothetical protein n=1 Tax=Bradyrhizobium sp. TaxID=376 RepID=UPI001C288BE1|nr:hypothetical protein [Bradyrhizobium sp.]MBU6461354.1 hypothetical protein [Pseudomonadota bacterium]MDE2066529.1 hypothetical protein [Bradyrhizobium sp.]MDE2467677.1 hypothetical protein [Bradyrhizobium sp.]